MFPYIEIEDIEIDLSSSEAWHSEAGALWKRAYKGISKAIPVMVKNNTIQTNWFDCQVTSPIQRYVNSIHVKQKHFKLTGTYEHVLSGLQMRDS